MMTRYFDLTRQGLTQVRRYFKKAAVIGLAIALFCSSLSLIPAQAQAAPNSQAGAIEKQRAEAEFNRKAGAGASNRLEGRVQEGVGSAKRAVGDFTDDAETEASGMADQVKGKAKRNLGRTQSAADDAAQQAKETGGGLINSIRNFFD